MNSYREAVKTGANDRPAFEPMRPSSSAQKLGSGVFAPAYDSEVKLGNIATIEDTEGRVSKGPTLLKDETLYTGQWLNDVRDGYGS